MRDIVRKGLVGLLAALVTACASPEPPGERAARSNGDVVPVTSLTQASTQPESNADAGPDIYVVDPRAGVATMLLSAPGSQANAELSPDGRLVVYESRAPGVPPQIFVLEADGTKRKLTDMKRGASDPTWSPGGTQIAFSGTRRGGGGSRFDSDIFVMNADGSRIRRLAGTPKHDGHPDWSPDGSRIAFHSGYKPRSNGVNPPPRGTIVVASLVDGTFARLTASYGGGQPAWSPDGRWIAYSRFSPGSSSGSGEWAYADLWIMRSDGSEKQHIGDRQHHAFWHDPSWSPNGRSIVLVAGGSVGFVDVESERLRVLIDALDAEPSWGPDGIVMSLSADDVAAMPQAAVQTGWAPTWQSTWTRPDATVVLTGSRCELDGGPSDIDPGVLAIEFVNESFREASIKVVRVPAGRRLGDLRAGPFIGGGWGDHNSPSATDVWSSPRAVASGRWAVACFKDLIATSNGAWIVPAGVAGPIEIG
jgi:Tol biopolymer transport system component